MTETVPPTLPPSAVRPDFVAALEKVGAQPLWDRFKSLVTREPVPPDAAFLWRWQDLQPLIDRAVREVPMEDAERRVLLLANPAFKGRVTTTTNLNAAIQILEPGESARPHRHRLAAIRFVLEGNGAETVVDGRALPMQRGDLLLTPSMSWHAHVNPSGKRIVWLDGLDLPLALHHLAIMSFQPGPPPSLPTTNAALRYAWTATRSALDAVPYDEDGAKWYRYSDPATGGPVMPTLDCYALELTPRALTQSRRVTYNAIVAVLEGEGQSRIGDQIIRWQRNDIFTIPHWHWASHETRDTSACLFVMTDREVLARLGYLVEEEAARPRLSAANKPT